MVIWRVVLAIWGLALLSLLWSVGRVAIDLGLSEAVGAWPAFLGVVFFVGTLSGLAGPRNARLGFLFAMASATAYLVTIDWGWFQLFVNGGPLGALGFYAKNPKLGYDAILLPVLVVATTLFLLVRWRAFAGPERTSV